jgi:hypothetical protein
VEVLATDLPSSLAPEAAAIALYVRVSALTTSTASAPSAGAPTPLARLAIIEPPHAAPSSRDLRPSQTHLPESAAEPGPVPAVETQFGGLFYLMSLVLELGIGESLWKVCLPEGQVLALAAAAILGETAGFDAAPALFGGVPPGMPVEPPPIAPEQQEEACREMLASLVAELPRFGVASPTEPVLDIVDAPAGRLLVAYAGFPVAIFAWPAPNPTAMAAGVDVFLSVWPQSLGAPSASGSVLEIERARNLRRSGGSTGGAACFLPDSGRGAAADALLAQLCGAVLHIFHSRLVAFGGEPAADRAALVSRYLELPGRIAPGPESLTVRLPMDRIEIDVRRAALDRDPGWAPWLRRTVRIEFEADRPGQVL